MGKVACVGALLVRNEATPDRYLARVLANVKQFCDEIVVLDDASTDDTVAVCKTAGATVHEREGGGGWWGGASPGEAPARAALWQYAVAAAGVDGWVYVADADHELLGIAPRDFRRLLTASEVDAWACPLMDCWHDDQHHRVDGWWQAWRLPRAWLARAYDAPQWSQRGIHAGHLPDRAWRVGLMPPSAFIRHLGYVTEQHRVDKRKKYLQIAVP